MSSTFLLTFLCLEVDVAFSTQTSGPLMRSSLHKSKLMWKEMHVDGSSTSSSDESGKDLNAGSMREFIVQSDATTMNALLERRTRPPVKQYLRLAPQKNVTEVSLLMKMGLESIAGSMQYFFAHPPNTAGAISHFSTTLWEIVEELVPANRKDDEIWHHGKQLWAQSFDSVGDQLTGIEEFQRTGEHSALVKDIDTILEIPIRVAQLIWPAATRVFLAIEETLDGLSDAWDYFEKGEWDAGISALYADVATAIRGLLPEDNMDADVSTAIPGLLAKGTWDEHNVDNVYGALDATIGDLHKHVTDFKREIDNGRVCYRTFPRRTRLGRPDQCQAHYVYDGVTGCIPDANHGADCWKSCGKKPGFCPDYCGEEKACCRRNDDSDPCECLDAGGYVDNPQSKGTPDDYHQCITPGPWRSEDTASLLALSNEGLADLDRSLVTKRSNDEGKPTDKCPYKASVIPSLAFFAGNRTRKPQTLTRTTQTLEKAVHAKDAAYGSILSTCLAGERIKGYCYDYCPAGYRRSGNDKICETDCSQLSTHPVEVGLWCAVELGDAVQSAQRIGMMTINFGVTTLMNLFRKGGNNFVKILQSVTAVVEAAKALAKPTCSKYTGGTSSFAQQASSQEYREAMNVFVRFDSNRNGMVERGEIEQALVQLGLRVNVMDKVMASMDTNKDGTLQFHEVLALQRQNSVGYNSLISRAMR